MALFEVVVAVHEAFQKVPIRIKYIFYFENDPSQKVWGNLPASKLDLGTFILRGYIFENAFSIDKSRLEAENMPSQEEIHKL